MTRIRTTDENETKNLAEQATDFLEEEGTSHVNRRQQRPDIANWKKAKTFTVTNLTKYSHPFDLSVYIILLYPYFKGTKPRKCTNLVRTGTIQKPDKAGNHSTILTCYQLSQFPCVTSGH